jgi:hypothetical protein
MGLGGAGIAVASVSPKAAAQVAKPIIAPLFGSDDVSEGSRIIQPGQGLGQHHIVFSRRVFDPLTAEQRREAGEEYTATTAVRASGIGSALFNSAVLVGAEDANQYKIVGKIRSSLPGRKRSDGHRVIASPNWDAGRHQRLWVNEWEPVQEFCVVPPGMPDAIGDTDPHALYYQAALKMRERFRQHTIARLTELNEWQRKQANLVTVVHQPIYARPLGMKAGRHGGMADPNGPYTESDAYFNPNDEPGFEVACEFQTLLYRSHHGGADLDGFKEYSSTGEYPIDPPSSIEMGILMKLDREVLSSGILTANAKTRRGFFTSWRS